MTCIRRGGYIVCISPWHRLRLTDGRYVFLEWHGFLGPSLYHDRATRREISDWWDDLLICEAITWFVNRGEKA